MFHVKQSTALIVRPVHVSRETSNRPEMLVTDVSMGQSVRVPPPDSGA